MAEPFISEIRIMSFNFAPQGWALCNGQLLPINQNQALFALLGINYGGDGRVNFGLPDLRGRTPIHVGSGHTLGERGGEENHTLIMSEIPTHTHLININTSAAPNANTPANALLTSAPLGTNVAKEPANLQAMSNVATSIVGGSQAHLNMQPFLTLSFCIALQGIFPSQA